MISNILERNRGTIFLAKNNFFFTFATTSTTREGTMEALVLERKGKLAIRDITVDEVLGPLDVRIALHTVGVCGSDVHYYVEGEIGPFVVREPMILGHEASGTVIEVGSKVRTLAVGDRVCMEPGIPDPNSEESRLGCYNLDPHVRFWATPPIHGVLRPTVVHPEAFTFKLPDNVTFAEGAMVEPLAVGLHAANKAEIKPGDVALVTGAGPIGMVTALSALAAGCSEVLITDVVHEKLEVAKTLGPIIPINVAKHDLTDAVMKLTNGQGVDCIFECSGHAGVIERLFRPLKANGRVTFIGLPGKPVPYSIEESMLKEARVTSIFRYAHVFPRALKLMASGKIDVKPLITDVYSFDKSIEAFDYATKMRPTSVKVQITM